MIADIHARFFLIYILSTSQFVFKSTKFGSMFQDSGKNPLKKLYTRKINESF